MKTQRRLRRSFVAGRSTSSASRPRMPGQSGKPTIPWRPGLDMILFFRIYRHVELTIILKNPHSSTASDKEKKWNDSEMAPQDFEIAQNGLGNGGGVSGYEQRKVAPKRT